MAHAARAGDGKSGKRIVARYVRVDTFKGGHTEWEDWSFAFKRTIRSMSIDAYKKMVEVERSTEDIEELTELEPSLEQRSGELYDALCQFCTGEALSVIKSVDDMQGMRAWQKLFKKYNPKTMARGVRLLGEVTSPPKVKELRDIEVDVNRWEEKCKTLSTQFKEDLSNNMKIAVFTNMMPISIQDYIYTHVDSEATYESVKDKVRAVVSNKVAAETGPSPMDVGGVDRCKDHDQDEAHVDAVSMDVRCHRCHSFGHMARDCATPKGKGKGASGGVANTSRHFQKRRRQRKRQSRG